MAAEQSFEQLSESPCLFARKLGQGVSKSSIYVLLSDRGSKGQDSGSEDPALSYLLGGPLTRPLVGKEPGEIKGMVEDWNNGMMGLAAKAY